MKTPKQPLLADNAVTSGMVFSRTEADIQRSIDQKAMGFACIELLGKLENEFARSRALPREEYIDEAATTCRDMLELLTTFCNEYLAGKGDVQARDEIARAQTLSHTFDEVRSTRPLGNALLRAFWKADETDDIKDAHSKLGNGLIRAIAATMYHAIMAIGFESPMGQEIDQSTVVFVTELNQSWSIKS